LQEIDGEPAKKVLLVVYRSLIRSILEYGAVALDSMSNKNKKSWILFKQKPCVSHVVQHEARPLQRFKSIPLNSIY